MILGNTFKPIGIIFALVVGSVLLLSLYTYSHRRKTAAWARETTPTDFTQIQKSFPWITIIKKCYYTKGYVRYTDFPYPYISAIDGYLWLNNDDLLKYTDGKYATEVEAGWIPPFKPMLLPDEPLSWKLLFIRRNAYDPSYIETIYYEDSIRLLYFRLRCEEV